MRKTLIAANWKMFKTPDEAIAFTKAFIPLAAHHKHAEIVICPSPALLPAVVEAARHNPIHVGAQSMHWLESGAYTGETSPLQLKALGVTHVLIGHSERRQYFGESEPEVLRKTQAAIEHGLTPIVCVGERLEDRESGRTEEVLGAQFEGGIAPLTPEEFAKIVIAYEPIWAIGTGRTATPDMAAAAHKFIRGCVARKFGEAAAASVRILYGGSVKPDNVKSLMAEEDIDGALVGGASLDPKSFAAIVNF